MASVPIELTSGADTVSASPDDVTVNGTALTLNNTDQLDGGLGYDILQLSGSGTFNLSTLAQFTGFEEVRLTNLTTNNATLTLKDGTNLKVTLSDGTSAPPPFPGPTSISVNLSTGVDQIVGGNEGDSFNASRPEQLNGDTISGGGGNDSLNLSPVFSSGSDTVYDLRAVTLSGVENLFINGTGGPGFTIVQVNTQALAGFTSINGFQNAKLTTADATLDLSGKTIGSVLVESTNATGTTFTVNSAQAALQIAGGQGQDRLVVSGLTLTQAQRDQIFLGSVETIQDASGTYTKPPLLPGTISLTSGADTVSASPDDVTVNGTALTLNNTDQLDGGLGYDILQLSGSGTFNLSTLAQFTGFEEVRLTNLTTNNATLTLKDGTNLKVTLSDGTSAPPPFPGPTSISVNLSTGVDQIVGGNEGDSFNASRPEQLNGDTISGGGGNDSLNLSPVFSSGSDTVYDLRAVTLSGVEILSINSTSVGFTIVQVNTQALAGFTSISAFQNAKLTTADATLDLSGKSIGGVSVESTNATGTTFTVNSAQAALQIAGGQGQDRLVVSGLTLTQAQRDQIFLGSVETIQDASGTYTKPLLPPGTISLTSGADTVSASPDDVTVNGTALTLNNTDQLDGGLGYDILQLSGSGTFNLSTLAQFTGFEEVRLTNLTTSNATLTLKDGTNLKVTLSDGTSAPPPFPGPTSISVNLSTGVDQIVGGNEGDSFSASRPEQLNGDTISGGGGNDSLQLSPVFSSGSDTVYDLRAVTLSGVENLFINSTGGPGFTIVQVNTQALAGFTSINGFQNAKLTTADATLDLSGKTIGSVLVESTNATGTTFTVNSAQAALQIAGGQGQDRLVVSGLTLTQAQRDQIFLGSVETIQDASGTYTTVLRLAIPISDASSPEDALWTFQVPAGTFTGERSLIYTATLADDSALPAWLTFNGATRTFSGTPPLNFNGAIDVKVTASDGTLAASDTFTLVITPVNDAPVVAAAIADQSSPEDTAWTFQVPTGTFSDVDGNILSYTATLGNGATLPAWLTFNGATRTFSGTPPLNFNGAIDVKVTASDGTLAASDTFTLVITPVNDAPVVAAAIADQSSPEDTAWTFQVPTGTFSDVDGNILSYAATLGNGAALPAWLTFNGATRTFSGTPPLNFNGSIDVKVTASDGALAASDTFTLVITPVNDAPVVAAAIADQSSPEDTAWTFQVPTGTFSDVDGNILSYAATLGNGAALPAWLTFNGATRTFSGTPPLNFNGSIDVKVTASDGALAASDTFTLVITPVNDAPVVAAAIADQSSPEDTAWTFQVPTGTFSDVDGNILSYAATLGNGATLPAWLTFNGATRTFSGTPPLNFNGSIDVKVTASDGALAASDTFTLVITPVNDAPVVAAAIADQSSPEDTAWTFQVPTGTFSDVDGNILSYAATLGNDAALPAWLTFNAATRTFSGTPPLNFNGSIDVKVTASDGALAASDTFTLVITPAPASFEGPSFQLAAFGPGAGGWASDDLYPRELADVNGDGLADIVGFGQAGVQVSLATGLGHFAAPTFELAAFGPGAGGWASDDLYPRELADVNGDGLADIVGFGQAGVQVSLATGLGHFAAPTFELAAFGPGAGGWASDDQYPRELADVNGDGLADIVGFGQAGVQVSLATGLGHFAAPTFELAAFGPGAGGWASDDQYPRELADVNGDGQADIVGFGQAGEHVSLAAGLGHFAAPTFELAFFAPGAGGWASDDLYARELADVNGDGRADIVGFGQAGVQVSLATGPGHFATPTFELDAFGPGAGGWASDDQYPRELADVNGGGRADIVGFGQAGVQVSQAHDFLPT